MPSSCSSENNGCSACGPGLGIYAISASTSQGKVGYGCINGEPSLDVYSTMTTDLLEKDAGSQSPPCSLSGEFGVYSWIYNSIGKYIYIVDEYGNIIILNTDTTDGTMSLVFTNPNQENGTSTTSATVRHRTSVNSGSCPISTTSDSYCLYCYNEECVDECYYSVCPEWGDSSSSCTQSTCSARAYCPYSYNVTTKIADKKDLSFFHNLCKSSVSTKMSLLEINGPQNCQGNKCGNGKEDDCWGGSGGFTLYSNNLDDPNATTTLSQKVKFRIAANKETLEKKYESIGGKVIFYTPTSNDAEEGRTPCCNREDFEGTVHKEVGYSLSPGSKSFKDSMVCQDLTEFENEGGIVGVGVQICYTIDQVSLME